MLNQHSHLDFNELQREFCALKNEGKKVDEEEEIIGGVGIVEQQGSNHMYQLLGGEV